MRTLDDDLNDLKQCASEVSEPSSLPIARIKRGFF